ncbi:MAG TPA: heme-binding protein [Gemmatimonadales bacterium]
MSGKQSHAALALAAALALGSCTGDTPGPLEIPTDPIDNPTTLNPKEQLQHSLPAYDEIRARLQEIVADQNGGLGFHMWAVIVDRDGFVLDVLFSGDDRASEWPGSRAIAAQKANTANAFSLDGFALSSANLYAPTQPGGSLYGLQESNPVDPDVAYGGNPLLYGTENDPMTGRRIGGINVFGGGLALYSAEGVLLGGLGLSGDTSCTDHIIAWKLRHALNLDNVPAGPDPDSGTDNIIYKQAKLDGFEHPTCFDTPGRGDHIDIGNDLPTTHPVGAAP